jgi:Ca2+-binding RTX toxin-like protein
MKTLVSILAVGITFLSYSQEPNNQTPLVELDNVVVSTVNSNYLAAVQDQNTPQEVALLQKQAAIYDVRTSKEFDSNIKNETFEMIFKNSNGSINAFYNASGGIESAYERFRNILLPRSVQRELYQSHKDWNMVGNQYASSYEGNDLIDRSYKIKLEKGNDKKNVVIHLPKK